MSKGNLFQGMARGKIGDVVFSRLNGQQVSRVRNRNPKNPRSNAQLYQRAIMATIMQAYSAGKQIFDHSFQGVSVGAGCQAVFMRQNLKSLRTKLSHEINDGVLADDLTVHCVYPGSTSSVPNEYLISMGTYDQKAFTPEVLSSGVAFTLPAPENNETVAAFCARVGLIPDDYYTFCFFLSGEDVLYEAPTANDDSLGQVFDCQFGFARLHVRSNVKSIDSPVADWIDVFEIDETANCAPTFIYGSITFGISLEALDYQQNGAGALGCIRSRKDKDLRSTSYMFCPPSGEVGINEFGLCANYVLESWKAGTQSLGNSDLILEGGGGAKPAPAPSNNWGLLVTNFDSTVPNGRSIAIVYDNAVPKIAVVKVNQVTAGSYSIENARAMVVGGPNDDTDRQDVNTIFVGAANQYSSNDSIALFNNNEEGMEGQSLMEALLGHFPIVESDLYVIETIEQVTQQNDGYIVSQQDVLDLLPVNFIGAINV